MNYLKTHLFVARMAIVLHGTLLFAAGAVAQNPAEYYTEPQVYGTRPNPVGEAELGPIGAAGIEARIYKGVTVTVEETQPDTPADGKFDKGDVILGVNGVKLKGKNPLVVLGTVLTGAESTDGVLTFDVRPAREGDARVKQVTIRIPVMGAYSSTFPLDSEKSDKIILQHYCDDAKSRQHYGIGWGRWGHDLNPAYEADRAFFSIKHHRDFSKYGEEDELHIPFRQLPIRLQYGPQDVEGLTLDMMLKNVRHARHSFRAGAAKALCMNKQFGEVEKLLVDPDPRLRRAALDGINDIHPWFTAPIIGKHALKAEAYTPAMSDAITKIMNDPGEAWFVVDAALLALNHAPVEVVQKNIPQVLPWTTHEDWWLRESAFMALMGLQEDEKLFLEYLPIMTDIMTKEYRYNPRNRMIQQFTEALKKRKNDSPVGKLIVAGFAHATMESKVLPDVGEYPRSKEGTVNVMEIALASITRVPEGAPALAEALVKGGRVEAFDTPTITRLLKSADGDISDRHIGLYPALETVPPQQKQRLADILYTNFRPELIKRLKAGDRKNERVLIDLILDLTKLKKSVVGWQAVGEPSPDDRIWRYFSFDPLRAEDRVHPRLWERFRTAALPAGIDGWMSPGFDDSGWKRGATPIGVGVFKAHGHGRMWTATPDHSFKNKTDWGDGEFLLMRTTFDVADADLDHDYYRIRLLRAKGYTIFLNGKQIKTYPWSSHFPKYEMIMLGDQKRKHLKKGANTLAVYCMAGYEKDEKTADYHAVGQMDLAIEGLKSEDLGLER